MTFVDGRSNIAGMKKDTKQKLVQAGIEAMQGKSYHSVGIKEILDSVGVPKGSFYYYFKSKEDLLDDLVEKRADQLMETWGEIIVDENLDALQKLNMILGAREVGTTDKELAKLYLKVMYKDENILMRHKMFKKWIEVGTAEFAKIIEQGVQDGSFNTKYPRESMKLILMLLWAPLNG